MELNMLSLVVLFGFALLLWFFQRTSKKPTFPPGPKGLPFIGNLHQLDNSALGINLYELSKKHGSLFSLQLGSRKTLVISSPKLAKEVMKTQDINFCNRPPLISHMKLSYDGLDIVFSPYRDYWRHTKKLAFIHFLSVKRISTFSSIRKQEVTQMIKRMSERASTSKVMNLHELITCLTSSIVCRTAFGRRYEEEGIERSKFHDILKEVMDLTIMFFYTDYFPLFGGILDRITGKMGRLENLYNVLDGFYQGIIDEHLDPEREKLPADELDVIDGLIQLKNDPHFSIHLTPIHLKPLIMNILMAGTDTSASAIVWAMTALMKDPRVMNKVQEEIRNVFGKKGFIEEEDVQKLPYLKAIIKETLRLYPPLPLLLPRETMKKCNFVGYEIPEKTLVYVNAWAVHRDPEAWKNPEEFYPERFLDNTIDFRGLDFELIPFGSGRRLCAGLNMANTTIELVLANLLYSFDWELPKGMKREEIDTEALQGLIQHKKNPLNLVAKKRMECDMESAC